MAFRQVAAFCGDLSRGYGRKVASRSDVDTLTLRLARGSVAPMTDTARWLRDNGFQEVDYVYEPGQFAIRGSILDIFGYSYEMPYRLDFFGDEIDSIRTFNTETQLSEQQVASVAVTANVASSARGESLLDFIPADTLIAVRDAAYTLQRIEAVSNESFSQSSLIADEGDADAMQKVVDPEAFAKAFDGFARLLFSAAAMPEGKELKASIDFGCTPQGVYHKNFDIISESLSRFLADGYYICILSDSPKQIERLKAIFADRGDDIPFTLIGTAIHAGFVDHRLKLCVFTDHQIFDRFHKYSLKSDRARSGKLALSLKELSH